jgi:hypothetical protein
MTENEIGTICIEAAIALHRELGPGLLESVYETIWPMNWAGGACASSVRFQFRFPSKA